MVDLTDEEIAAIEKAYALFMTRSEYDTEMLAEIREHRSGESHALFRKHRDVLETIGNADVSTLVGLLEKIKMWRTTAAE
jgi:hypothetical protein